MSGTVTKNNPTEPIFKEIVESIGRDELIKQARRDGSMRWSGLSEYLRKEKAREEEAD